MYMHLCVARAMHRGAGAVDRSESQDVTLHDSLMPPRASSCESGSLRLTYYLTSFMGTLVMVL